MMTGVGTAKWTQFSVEGIPSMFTEFPLYSSEATRSGYSTSALWPWTQSA